VSWSGQAQPEEGRGRRRTGSQGRAGVRCRRPEKRRKKGEEKEERKKRKKRKEERKKRKGRGKWTTEKDKK
jgi:hypothetical protein